MSTRKTKKFLINLTLLFFSIFLSLFLAEIILRIVNPGPRELEPLNCKTYTLSQNPILKYEYSPGYLTSQKPFDRTHTNFAINSDGFRDYEYGEEKSPRITRVIVLGDSITAGNGVSDVSKVYPKIMETLLNSGASEEKYEVLNMGVGGYHTLQEAETLRVKGRKYNPDIVIVGFCLNDFFPNSDGGVYTSLLKRQKQRNTFTYQKFKYGLYRSLLTNSRLFTFISSKFFPDLLVPMTVREYRNRYLENINPVEAGFELLNTIAEEDEFNLYVFIIPAFVGDLSKYPPKLAKMHTDVFDIADNYSNIRCLDLLDDLRSINSDGKKFSFDSCHLNEYGHNILANLIVENIAPLAQRSKVP
jgi:lysophospholipase L1-like esterase